MKLKKISLVIWVLVVISLIFGGLVVFGDKSGDAAAYFPLKQGNVWTYKRSIVGDISFFKIKVTDPENGNPKIIVYDPNGNPRDFVYYTENQRGLFKVKEMGSAGVFEYHPLWRVLGSTMKVGATWNWESDDHKMKETAKVTASEKVTVPAGTFNTILIEYTGIDQRGMAYSDKTWYAKGIGYVKDEFTMSGNKILCELSEYQLAK